MAPGSITANAIPTTVASLGVTPQPAVTSAPAGTSGGNSAISTGFDQNPVVGGGPANNNNAIAAAAANTGLTQQGVRAAQNTVANQFGAPLANDFTNAAGGGSISSALQSGVARIAAFAQDGIKGIENAIQGDMAANGGQVDPAKMQKYTMQMSTFEMIMQMAAKIQEKQEAAAQVWLRL